MKELHKNKKFVIGFVLVVLVLGIIGGYLIYDNNRKETIKDAMSITFTDIKEVEYGTMNYDVKKELVKKVGNAKIEDFSKINTSTIGEQTLTFTLVKSDAKKIIEHKIKIVDTKAPIITLETESKKLFVNDEYDFMSNIKEVKDEVDGAIKLNNDVLEINKNATEEYNKLSKANIDDKIKVANTPLKDFLIEDIESKEEKMLSLKNCYYVDGVVDTSMVGEYKITIIAIDINGHKTTKSFNVIVKEKEIVISTTQGNNYIAESSSTGTNGGSIAYPDYVFGDGFCPMNHPDFARTKEQAQARADELGLKVDEYGLIPEVCSCGFSSWYVNVDPDTSRRSPFPWEPNF